MAVPRDPNFWRRFSTAVHLDEEAQVTQKQETWHESTVRKNRGSHLRVCLAFWILLLVIIAIIVVVCLVLIKTGVLKKIHIGGEGHKVNIDLQGWLNKVFGTGRDSGEKDGSGASEKRR